MSAISRFFGSEKSTTTSTGSTKSNIESFYHDVHKDEALNQTDYSPYSMHLNNETEKVKPINNTSFNPEIIKNIQLEARNEMPTQLSYDENYEHLKKKIENVEIYKIFENLEKIVDSVQNLQKDNENQDHQLESWTPLMESIEDFSQKKLILQDLENQYKQTLSEMRSIHLKMFENLKQVKLYNAQREAIYAARGKLASDLEKRLQLFETGL